MWKSRIELRDNKIISKFVDSMDSIRLKIDSNVPVMALQQNNTNILKAVFPGL
jgi:hypothetical protein